jgi:hypothetical protein
VRDEALTLWHLMMLGILLLPVAHFGYLLVPLPMLWIRIGRLLQRPGSLARDWAATTAVALWWLVCLRTPWSDLVDGTFGTTTYLAMLGSSFLAVSASVFANVPIPAPGRGDRGARETATEPASHVTAG